MRPRSIRRFLLGGTFAILLAVLGITAWIGFAAGQHEADELFDARLATSARVLAALVAAPAATAPAAPPMVVSLPEPLAGAREGPGPLGHPYETKIAFQLLDAQGRLLMRSASAPAAPYAALEPGFSTERIGTQAWRVFTLRSGEHWVQAAESDDARGELSLDLALATVTPLLAGIPLLLLLLWLLMRYGLEPLAELARRIERREPRSLTPIELVRATEETAPVAAALNGLLERVRAALERERRFTADAAHELRTPLAALKVHAQNAARAASEAERKASLERMLAGLDRSIRLAEQMLAYSRATAAGAPMSLEELGLREVIEDVLDDLLPQLKERSVRVSVESVPPLADLALRGDRDKLSSLVRNLLDNAARHAPAGSTIRVELARDGRHAQLSIVDQGPGIPKALRGRVFESYFRVPGSAGGRSGLGLAIVREIAAQHDATVEIRDGDDGVGTRVVVRFPPA